MRHRMLLEAVRRHVCPYCVHAIFDNDYRFRECRFPKERGCPIKAHLRRVIAILPASGSPRQALEQTVCTQCEHDKSGFCELRLDGECPLYRHLWLIRGMIRRPQVAHHPGHKEAELHA